MSNEEIIELANQSTHNFSVFHHVFDREQLVAFARLVLAEQRNEIATWVELRSWEPGSVSSKIARKIRSMN